MSLPSSHPLLREAFLSVYCPSIGGTPVSAYLRVPFRCRASLLGVMPQGVITTADCAVAVAVNGVAVSTAAGTLPVSTAAAGTGATWNPTSPLHLNEDDVIKFTPSGASGSTIAAQFTANLIAE